MEMLSSTSSLTHLKMPFNLLKRPSKVLKMIPMLDIVIIEYFFLKCNRNVFSLKLRKK